ncbi:MULTISPECIES: hypothetical protein [Burkholderiaceae]|jgi:hypothetical protein|uniref:hypothetical protein n=1 Tax=Burkholderiaceae TaxID=119060 RepID=UPI000D079549|nr:MULTISPECIES: hypothetical protein [Burkholderiaceae]MBU9366363.1 hypothetical protein [Burkholderia multivorans]PRZ43828.1 hypothetical protein BX589_1498 [Paraburkholderia fungorum]
MMNEIPTKAEAEQKRTLKVTVALALLAAASWLWLQIDPYSGQWDDLLRKWIVGGATICVLAALYFGVRCVLVSLWPARFSKTSSAWDAAVQDALEKHFPGTTVTPFGDSGWLVTDKATGKTKAEVSGPDALRELGIL